MRYRSGLLTRHFHRRSSPARTTDPSADALLSTAHSSLQDLGVVPQTIFFTVKPQSEALNAARTRLTTQSPSEFTGGGFLGRRTSSTATGGADILRSPNSQSGERPASGRSVSAGQLTEDLRRRLALGGVGGSNASLSSLQFDSTSIARTNDGPRASGAAAVLEPPINLHASDLHLKRTVSHTDTEISDVTTSSATSAFSNPSSPVPGLRPPARSRVRLSGVEVAKVSPAVAEDSTNAMGLFDVDARYKESSETGIGGSNAGTEMNSATGALGKSTGKKIAPPQRFVSTYGWSGIPAISPCE